MVFSFQRFLVQGSLHNPMFCMRGFFFGGGRVSLYFASFFFFQRFLFERRKCFFQRGLVLFLCLRSFVSCYQRVFFQSGCFFFPKECMFLFFSVSQIFYVFFFFFFFDFFRRFLFSKVFFFSFAFFFFQVFFFRVFFFFEGSFALDFFFKEFCKEVCLFFSKFFISNFLKTKVFQSFFFKKKFVFS